MDSFGQRIFPGSIAIDQGKITTITEHSTTQSRYTLLGSVDAHIHLERSMVTPEHFGHLVIHRGTIAVIADPHEIAHVPGRQGVEYMIKNSERSPMKFFYHSLGGFVSRGRHCRLENIGRRYRANGRLVVCSGNRTQTFMLPMAGGINCHNRHSETQEYEQLHTLL